MSQQLIQRHDLGPGRQLSAAGDDAHMHETSPGGRVKEGIPKGTTCVSEPLAAVKPAHWLIMPLIHHRMAGHLSIWNSSLHFNFEI